MTPGSILLYSLFLNSDSVLDLQLGFTRGTEYMCYVLPGGSTVGKCRLGSQGTQDPAWGGRSGAQCRGQCESVVKSQVALQAWRSWPQTPTGDSEDGRPREGEKKNPLLLAFPFLFHCTPAPSHGSVPPTSGVGLPPLFLWSTCVSLGPSSCSTRQFLLRLTNLLQSTIKGLELYTHQTQAHVKAGAWTMCALWVKLFTLFQSWCDTALPGSPWRGDVMLSHLSIF